MSGYKTAHTHSPDYFNGVTCQSAYIALQMETAGARGTSLLSELLVGFQVEEPEAVPSQFVHMPV